MEGSMERICKRCGKPFIPETYCQKYCEKACQLEANREQTKERMRRLKECNRKKTSLKQLTVEARKAGMSYGQYVAMKGL